MTMKHVKGFRFHPTDAEAMEHLWEKQVVGRDSFVQVGGSLVPVITQFKDICRFEPGELPGRSKLQSGDGISYFFCSPRYKYRNSKRKNRVTKKGYWKPTGNPRQIVTTCDGVMIAGTRQTLVFYEGRVCDRNKKENRTPWVIHEFELTLNLPNQKSLTLCKLKKKRGKVVSRVEEGQSNLYLPSNIENHCTNNVIPEDQLNSKEPLAFTENSGIQSELVNKEQSTDEFVDSLIKKDELYSKQLSFPYEEEDFNQIYIVNTDIQKNQEGSGELIKQKLKAPNGCEEDNSSWSSIVVANDPTKSNGDGSQQNTSIAEEGSSLAFENHAPIPTEGSDFDEFVRNGIKHIAELLLPVPEAPKNSEEVHNRQFGINEQDDEFWESIFFTTD